MSGRDKKVEIKQNKKSQEVIGRFKSDILVAEDAVSKAKTDHKNIQYKIFAVKFVEACDSDIIKLNDTISFLTEYRDALSE